MLKSTLKLTAYIASISSGEVALLKPTMIAVVLIFG